MCQPFRWPHGCMLRAAFGLRPRRLFRRVGCLLYSPPVSSSSRLDHTYLTLSLLLYHPLKCLPSTGPKFSPFPTLGTYTSRFRRLRGVASSSSVLVFCLHFLALLPLPHSPVSVNVPVVASRGAVLCCSAPVGSPPPSPLARGVAPVRALA